MKTKQPFHIRVFEVAISDYDIMLSYIFLRDLRLKKNAYIKFPEEVILLVSPRSNNITLHRAT